MSQIGYMNHQPGSEPFVSMVINNYNYGQYLGEAINSALNHTYRAVETIMVDDGSTDQSHEVICGYRDRVVPISRDNGEQASAMNVRFARSHGDFVIFLGTVWLADVFLFSEKRELINNILGDLHVKS